MYELRDYQQKVHNSTIEHMRETYRSGKFDPAFANVTVGGGKTVLIAFAVQQIMTREGNSVLVLARQGELIAQNSEDARAIGIKLSIFSASLNQKSTYYPVIFGTEGTVGRALNNEFKDSTFTAILIDECFTPDTEITTKNGVFKISDPRIINEEIKCFDESSGKIYFDKPKRVWSNGIKRISRVKLSNGDIIKCTKNHKIYSNGLWVSVENLSIGQEITFQDSSSSTMKKLFRATAAVARRLMLELARN